jgi:CRP-like cAMP-binding protein
MESGREHLLDAAEVFGAVSSAARRAAAESAVGRSFARGRVLFREGDRADALLLVVEGRVKLTQIAADGNEVIVRFVGPGQVCAAVAAIAGSSYPATARALQSTRVLVWSQEAWAQLCAAFPALTASLMKLLAERMREMQERFRELATERVAQRVARTLLRLVRQAGRKAERGVLIDMPLSRQSLAEMTGTTLFTVSRIVADWEARGILASGRERLVILSPHALVAIAEDLPPHGAKPQT